ncbi:hypothetical protein VTN77DRAFT_9486 [Rasamsonia byssochlamydoides]|uniref:uncharacterized protein n=1 Tax=Rasamsonia byssochlamydoides TaxID=89139 RepID=UPI0037442A33
MGGSGDEVIDQSQPRKPTTEGNCLFGSDIIIVAASDSRFSSSLAAWQHGQTLCLPSAQTGVSFETCTAWIACPPSLPLFVISRCLVVAIATRTRTALLAADQLAHRIWPDF